MVATATITATSEQKRRAVLRISQHFPRLAPGHGTMSEKGKWCNVVGCKNDKHVQSPIDAARKFMNQHPFWGK